MWRNPSWTEHIWKHLNMVDKKWRRRKSYQWSLKQQKKEMISAAELHVSSSQLIDWRAAAAPRRRSSDAEESRVPRLMWASRILISSEDTSSWWTPPPLPTYTQSYSEPADLWGGSGHFWLAFWKIRTEKNDLTFFKIVCFWFSVFFPPFCWRYNRLKLIHYNGKHDILLFYSLCTQSNLQDVHK